MFYALKNILHIVLIILTLTLPALGSAYNNSNLTEAQFNAVISIVNNYILQDFSGLFLDTKVSNISKNYALIEYRGYKKVQGQLEYGESKNYGSRTTKETSFNYSKHIQGIPGLKSSTTYHYRAHLWDKNGDETISKNWDFTTLADQIYIENNNPVYRNNSATLQSSL